MEITLTGRGATAPLDLAAFLTRSISGIIGVIALLTEHVLVILCLLKRFLFLFLKVSVSH